MTKRQFTIKILAAFTTLCLAPGLASALEPVAWQTDVAAARQLAQQSNRLLLLHFWSVNCGPCRALETKVFSQPGFAQTLSVHYVPVKVNVEEQPALVQAYKITQYPTEVVVGLDGREISRFRAPQNPASYLATATQIARANPPVLKPFDAGPATAPSLASVQPNLPSGQPPVVHQAAMTSPQQQPQVATAPTAGSTEPPALGLDGYCPVRLCENHAWVRGNRQYGVNHRGRLYLFAGPGEQQKFWQNPDRYTPVGGGEDQVAALDQGLRVAGKREFGMFLDNRVYLFSTEESLQRFKQNPNRYSIEMQAGRPPVQRY